MGELKDGQAGGVTMAKPGSIRIVSDGTSRGTRVEDASGNVIQRVTRVEWSIGPDRLGRAAIHCVGVELDVVAPDAEAVIESAEDDAARMDVAPHWERHREGRRSGLRAWARVVACVLTPWALVALVVLLVERGCS